MDVDKEDLIAKIFLKKVIWDKRSKGHANRNMVDKSWRELAEEVGIEEIILRKKWKNLRDQFAVEIGKFSFPRSGDPGEIIYHSKWPFFKPLMFLKDIVKPRTSSGNLISKIKPTDEVDDGTIQLVTDDLNPSTEPTEDIEEVKGQIPVILVNTGRTSPHESQPVQQSAPSETAMSSRQHNSRKRSAMKDKYDQQILSIEGKKGKIQERVLDERTSRPDCEDLMFFRTLLSHVKKIPPHVKLRFRTRIEEVVQEFAYPGSQP